MGRDLSRPMQGSQRRKRVAAAGGESRRLVDNRTEVNDVVTGPGGRQILIDDRSGTRSSSSSRPPDTVTGERRARLGPAGRTQPER